ncbi:DegV family protein [Miniphocaeibacter halophilus]|uniref:DegV family protein n=1 Tax=Miniphocaeibacter halophilus TaxID=2931922 RepID=A0AC61MT45_9FIRM|nr:DegV family protein [Miniphocaeibacter halophilus]QQK07579.1 DegV family protein [Miniphocaeibacter halophilus]
MALKVIVDSGSDIPEELVEKYDLIMLPLTVISGDKEYSDGVDITSKELTDRMKQGEVFTTSQVTYDQFYNKFKEEIEKGNEIVYIALSAGISGCYNSGVLAMNDILKEYPEASIDVINSNCASLGIGLVAIRAAILVKNGFDSKYIVDKIKFLADNVEHYFTVDDMQYLYRGGRVTATQKILGGMLNIKPMLTVDKGNGKLIPIDKGRGLKQVYRKIISKIKEDIADNNLFKTQTMAIVHSDFLENALELKNMISNELGAENIIVGNIGSTISAHTGPGCIAVFINKKEIGDEIDVFEN